MWVGGCVGRSEGRNELKARGRGGRDTEVGKRDGKED